MQIIFLVDTLILAGLRIRADQHRHLTKKTTDSSYVYNYLISPYHTCKKSENNILLLVWSGKDMKQEYQREYPQAGLMCTKRAPF
jgi:hypothetical protein